MRQSTDYQDGCAAAMAGKKDKSEMYAMTWGFKAGTDYAAGYSKGERDAEAAPIKATSGYLNLPARSEQEVRAHNANSLSRAIFGDQK